MAIKSNNACEAISIRNFKDTPHSLWRVITGMQRVQKWPNISDRKDRKQSPSPKNRKKHLKTQCWYDNIELFPLKGGRGLFIDKPNDGMAISNSTCYMGYRVRTRHSKIRDLRSHRVESEPGSISAESPPNHADGSLEPEAWFGLPRGLVFQKSLISTGLV